MAEKETCPFVVGLKRWYFMDSSSGATASAAYYSLLEMARLYGHDATKYMIHIFEQLATHPTDVDIRDLLSYSLKPSNH